ncbi:hypothetical protein [Micromonospora sp. NPDC093277]|uniref:hypothetical protein n=1 Tax=Micromonospora sp. NPDC093277 TaxID=3364291 RepID=UPI0037F350F1
MIEVDVGAIRALAKDIEQQTAPGLEAASERLNNTRAIEHSNFTTVVPALAVVYVAAVEFMEEELRTKRTHLIEIESRLNTNADNWEATEDASTIVTR